MGAGAMPKVYLDPGHGGNDPGALYGNRREKDDNLTYALELKRLLEAQGCEVIMARTGEADLTPSQRAAQANAAKADVYISCHRNAGGGTGVELWLHHQAPARYITWAQDMIAGFKKLPMPIRNSQNASRVSEGVFKGYPGAPTGNFAVNRETTMPSILIELGFMGKDDAAFDSHYKAYVEVIAKATCKFLGVEYKESSVDNTSDLAAQLVLVTKERDAARQERDQALARAEAAEARVTTMVAGMQRLIDKHTK